MKLRINCGELVVESRNQEYHPVKAVEQALTVVKDVNKGISLSINSNNPDFIQAIKYLGEKYNIEVEFFLNGESIGNDIEPIFEDLNRGYFLLDKLLKDKEL